MAVYEMGVALTPASQMLEQATKRKPKLPNSTPNWRPSTRKKPTANSKLAELAAKKAKAEADLEESLKRNEESRQDAISLTDYQKKQLSEVEAREANHHQAV